MKSGNEGEKAIGDFVMPLVFIYFFTIDMRIILSRGLQSLCSNLVLVDSYYIRASMSG